VDSLTSFHSVRKISSRCWRDALFQQGHTLEIQTRGCYFLRFRLSEVVAGLAKRRFWRYKILSPASTLSAQMSQEGKKETREKRVDFEALPLPSFDKPPALRIQLSTDSVGASPIRTMDAVAGNRRPSSGAGTRRLSSAGPEDLKPVRAFARVRAILPGEPDYKSLLRVE
jgi:hypothetical protein